MNYLLKGLSTSPALRTGDLKSFYDQLTATPVPEGSWLILHDLEGQVLNTLRPFGAALPRHSDFRTSPVPRVREVGWAVSGRTASLLRPGASTVGLSLESRLRGRAHEALSHGNCLGSSAQGDRDGTRASPCHTHRCLRPRPPAPFCARAGEPPVASNRAANAQKPPCRRRTGASCGELARERRRTGHRGSRRAVALSRDGLDLGDGDPGSRHQCPAAECGSCKSPPPSSSCCWSAAWSLTS